MASGHREIRRYGPLALLVDPGSRTRPADFAAAVNVSARPDVVEVIPAADTVLVVLATDAPQDEIADWLDRLDVTSLGPGEGNAPTAREIVIDVSYDGADLAEVADAVGSSLTDVVALHSGALYRCEFCGFAPGFAYLSGLDPSLVLPRRSTPRTSVPAGSVAVAGPYSAVYPSVSPGGWNLIGHTDAVLFDAAASPPALITPGTQVRFRPISGSGREPSRHVRGIPSRSGSEEIPAQLGERRWALRVQRAGYSTSFQDGGRAGHGALGVSSSGALDPVQRDLVNRLVGNVAGEAVLETAGGLVLAAVEPVVVADSGTGAVRSMAAGDTIRVEALHAVWAYLAVRGGFAVEPMLGSRSWDTLSGIGPGPPGVGEALPVGPDPRTPIYADRAPVAAPPPALRLRVWPGPNLDWFDDDAFDRLVTTTWSTTIDTSRIGRRLRGCRLSRHPDAAGRELPSAGLVLGAVQVPADGQLVVMFADHPTTGGYPVIGVVDGHDLPELVHARPETDVTFRDARPRPGHTARG